MELYNEFSTCLVLGSFPSVKSREEGFFYGHKQNRFWQVISAVFKEKTPLTIAEKKEFLLKDFLFSVRQIHQQLLINVLF